MAGQRVIEMSGGAPRTIEMRSDEPETGAAFTRTRDSKVIGYIQQTTDCKRVQCGYSEDENYIKRMVGIPETHQLPYGAHLWFQGLNGARIICDRQGALDFLAFLRQIEPLLDGSLEAMLNDSPTMISEARALTDQISNPDQSISQKKTP